MMSKYLHRKFMWHGRLWSVMEVTDYEESFGSIYAIRQENQGFEKVMHIDDTTLENLEFTSDIEWVWD